MPYRTVPVLKVGRYRLPDGRWFESTRDKNLRICAQANAQLAAGIRHPVSWMHDPAAEPVHLSNAVHKDAWLARGYFGEPCKFVTDAAGNVLAKVLIHRQSDAEQFDLVGQVSPGLYAGWVDERGVRWPEMTVLHIAATPKPIQRDLQRVTDYPATFLSQPAGKPGAICLSFPATTRSVTMADEFETEEVDTEGGANLSAEHIGKIVEMLKKHGLMLADGIADADDLLLALESASKTMTGGDGGVEPDGDEVGGDGMDDGMTDAPPPVMMSHLVKRVAEFEVKDRNGKLLALLKSGRITKPQYEKRHKQLNAVNLSQPVSALFHKDGKFNAGDLDVFLEVAAELSPNPLSKDARVDLGNEVVPVAVPADAADQEDKLAEERKKAAKRTGVKLKQ